ncbi:toll/interleukin-1 receptor domain-containing protein [Microbulbifer sp. CnH-101-G]|uniref:toll/interleukin-1 receptor domain-containing protein n=1 Tax=Microbulbifer sp. CnH-101-G TaxID=3243393 RepID=UPI00403A5714
MTIFISYSHADKDRVDSLATAMVNRNAQVWLDRWELNVGDSLIERIQDALTEADALLVVLSKASVQSQWCKKELNSGLFRELGEKRVVVLPVLLEDCEIPLFLREKMYADLRRDFSSGIHEIMNAVGKVSNPNQSRFDDGGNYIDWGETKGLYNIRFTILESYLSQRMTVLTEIVVICNEVMSARQKQYENAGLDWVGRMIIAEQLFNYASRKELKVILDSTLPKAVSATDIDPKTGVEYSVSTTC